MMEMKEKAGENRGELVPDRGGGQEADREETWAREGTTETKGGGETEIERRRRRRRRRGSRVERVDEPEGR